MADQLFTALAHTCRRRLLVTLLERDPQDEIPIPEAVHEGETDRETLHETLVHTHLPHLVDAGFVRWERDAHLVTRGPRFGEIAPLVRVLLEHADELPEDLL